MQEFIYLQCIQFISAFAAFCFTRIIAAQCRMANDCKYNIESHIIDLDQFKFTNPETQRVVYGGVQEFSADEVNSVYFHTNLASLFLGNVLYASLDDGKSTFTRRRAGSHGKSHFSKGNVGICWNVKYSIVVWLNCSRAVRLLLKSTIINPFWNDL